MNNANPSLGSVPSGNVFTPWNFYEYYGFNQINGTSQGNINTDGYGQTIAIIDAYGCPTVQSDLDYFCQQMAIPSTNVDVYYPLGEPSWSTPSDIQLSWALETSLDVQYAHAMAVSAKIVLVNSPDARFSNLGNCISYAVNTLSADVISMSWGAAEDLTFYNTGFDNIFKSLSAQYLASSGDLAAQVVYPSSSPYVLSIGGTTLYGGNVRNYNGAPGSYYEVGWSNGGGGISTINQIPLYQKGWSSFSKRSVPDVSYNAGGYCAVYMTNPFTALSGWYSVGGTSASTPQWAAIIARRNSSGLSVKNKKTINEDIYGISISKYSTLFYDIIQGSNGYNASYGYDLVSGLGSPKVNYIIPPLLTPTPTPTITPTITPTNTPSPTPTITVTPSNTPSSTVTPTPTKTYVPKPTPTVTPTISNTPNPTQTSTPTPTTSRLTITATPTNTVTPTTSVTPSKTPIASRVPIVPLSPLPTRPIPPTPTPTPVITASVTPSNKIPEPPVPEPSHTPTRTPAATTTPTNTRTPAPTVTPTVTVTPSITRTPANSPTNTPTITPTPTNTAPATPTPTITTTPSITPTTSFYDSGLFSGWQNPSNKYRYLIQFDWDNCQMSATHVLTSDSIIADGVTYTSDTAFNKIDGLTVWRANGDGTATCVYASGNYKYATNFSGYAYEGTSKSVTTLRNGFLNNTKQSDVFAVGCTPSTGGCCAGATKTYPAAVLCGSWSATLKEDFVNNIGTFFYNASGITGPSNFAFSNNWFAVPQYGNTNPPALLTADAGMPYTFCRLANPGCVNNYYGFDRAYVAPNNVNCDFTLSTDFRIFGNTGSYADGFWFHIANTSVNNTTGQANALMFNDYDGEHSDRTGGIGCPKGVISAYIPLPYNGNIMRFWYRTSTGSPIKIGNWTAPFSLCDSSSHRLIQQYIFNGTTLSLNLTAIQYCNSKSAVTQNSISTTYVTATPVVYTNSFIISDPSIAPFSPRLIYDASQGLYNGYRDFGNISFKINYNT